MSQEKDVMRGIKSDEDYPGETVCVLKEKEVRLYGDAWQSGVKAGVGGVGCFGSMKNALVKRQRRLAKMLL